MVSVSPRCIALGEFLASIGEPRWRLRQVLQGIYAEHTHKWHNFEHLPVGLRMRLKERFGKYVLGYRPLSAREGDFAQKVLLESRRDAVRVEAVSLKFRTHRSLCISSQVGCAFQCAFCATGRVGLKRQLDADEICDQVLFFLQKGQKIDGVSFMGMGEPLANPRVFDALSVLTSPELFGISPRRLNVSTVGVIPGIMKLTEKFPQANLAFSLHSPFPEERNRLVPLNRMYPIAQVLEVLDQHIQLTGRRVWIGYLLMRGQNDSLEHARALAMLIRERPSHVRYLYHINLLPYNTGRAVPEHFARTDSTQVEAFRRVLQENSITSSFRNSFGHSIDAACGQLFADYEDAGPRGQARAAGAPRFLPKALEPSRATTAQA